MAYNTVPIKKDSEGKPIPQYYDKVKNEYEALEGHNGASKVILYAKDGNEVKMDDLLQELSLIEKWTAITNNVIIDKFDTQISDLLLELSRIYNKDTTKTLYGLSTETKPTTGMTKGNAYFEIDTSEVYMWDGTQWVVI